MIRILIIKIALRAYLVGVSSRSETHGQGQSRCNDKFGLYLFAQTSTSSAVPSRGYPVSSAADRMAAAKMLPYESLGAFGTSGLEMLEGLLAVPKGTREPLQNGEEVRQLVNSRLELVVF
jgi:hypothetical protein